MHTPVVIAKLYYPCGGAQGTLKRRRRIAPPLALSIRTRKPPNFAGILRACMCTSWQSLSGPTAAPPSGEKFLTRKVVFDGDAAAQSVRRSAHRVRRCAAHVPAKFQSSSTPPRAGASMRRRNARRKRFSIPSGALPRFLAWFSSEKRVQYILQ
jgi:hypothetical protein